MRQSRAVEVEFAGERRKVCCHGCASVLKTVEQMGMQKQYFAQKAQAASQDEK
ncbi:MAG: heavy metal translocating P-type ATPase metal-binding domain-containing protein [Burkholderiales bacterium]|nr:heavy metal translocating P-type ATPase metal-binding domain-containing protein [Burkholderiales bacterium]